MHSAALLSSPSSKRKPLPCFATIAALFVIITGIITSGRSNTSQLLLLPTPTTTLKVINETSDSMSASQITPPPTTTAMTTPRRTNAGLLEAEEVAAMFLNSDQAIADHHPLVNGTSQEEGTTAQRWMLRGNVTELLYRANRADKGHPLPSGLQYKVHSVVAKVDRNAMTRSILSQFLEWPAATAPHQKSAWGATATTTAEVHSNASAAAQPIFSTANAAQCLELARTTPVIALDKGAFGIEGRVGQGNAAISDALGVEYGFDNAHLYGTRRGGVVGNSSDDGIIPVASRDGDRPWASATFYDGPASDADLPNNPDPNVRARWARSKVRWVATSDANRNAEEDDNYWRDYDDEAEDGNLPCTQYIQHRLHALMNPRSCDAGGTGSAPHNSSSDDDDDEDPYEARSVDPAKYLVTLVQISEGWGIGAAFGVIAHDMLSAMVLGRVLLFQTPRERWRFVGKSCESAGRYTWECYWQFPSKCQYAVNDTILFKPVVIGSRAQGIQKQNETSLIKRAFDDVPGLSRTDVPSDEAFFGARFVKGTRRGDGTVSAPKCYQRYKEWTERDLSHNYFYDHYYHGMDPRNFYMLSQVTRYLTRFQQPWFYNMLAQAIYDVGMGHAVPTAEAARITVEENAVAISTPSDGSSDGNTPQRPVATIFLHERGEPKKFKEYMPRFACHNVKSDLLIDLTTSYCGVGDARNLRPLSRFNGTVQPRCHVFISGNTPPDGYANLTKKIGASARSGQQQIGISSTWNLFEQNHTNHSSSSGYRRRHGSRGDASAKGTARYGATSPSATWVDLYASIGASHWICIAQSNWCRLMGLLRGTAGRATCGGFVDPGLLMLTSPRLRDAHCIVYKNLRI